MRVVELRSDDELREAFALFRELRPGDPLFAREAEYLERARRLLAGGYRLFGVRDGDALVSVAGVELSDNLHAGRNACVQELVTTAAARSRGYGRRLMEFIEAFARDQACREVHLTSALARDDAHRFYERRLGYDRVAFKFRKALD